MYFVYVCINIYADINVHVHTHTRTNTCYIEIIHSGQSRSHLGSQQSCDVARRPKELV